MPALVKIQYQSVGDDQATQTAKRVRQSLVDLHGTSEQTAGSLGDRLSKAFQSLEEREPTMAVRRLHLAIEDLAISATGATGPLGRIATTFASLGLGGAVGIATVAGFAAIGFEIKKILDFSGDLEKSLTKGSQGFASMAGSAATAAFALGQTQERIEDLSHASTMERLIGMLNFTAGPGDLGVAMATGRESALATEENIRILQMRGIRQTHEDMGGISDRERTAAQAIESAAQPLARLALGAHASAAALINFNEQVALELLGFQKIDDATKTRIGHLIAETAAIERTNVQTAERLRVLINSGGVPGRGGTFGTFLLDNFGGPLPDLPGGTVTADPTLAREILFRISASQQTGLNFQDIGRADAGLSGGGRLDVQRLITGGLGLAGAARSGNVGGAIAGIGGIVSAVPGAQLPGAIIAGIGGLVSLFASGGAKVTIDDLSAKALEQLRNTIQLPTYLSQVITGANNPDALRGTRYQQGRMQARDTVPRTY